MATLAEISTLLNDGVLNDKCKSACLVAANAIQVENSGTANHANRLKWAKKALTDPTSVGTQMLRAVLGANSTATLAQINAATDSAIQTAVNAAVDTFADGT